MENKVSTTGAGTIFQFISVDHPKTEDLWSPINLIQRTEGMDGSFGHGNPQLGWLLRSHLQLLPQFKAEAALSSSGL